jgi:guanylate kinase
MMNSTTLNDRGVTLPHDNHLVVVISGPSGVGKDAILNRMKELKFPFEFITTVTTRPKRVNETHQVDYHFISVDEFHELQKSGGLLEWANVYGNYYGVPKSAVKESLSRGKDIIIKVDVQGAENIKTILPEAVFIFIAPPSVADLSDRLTGRCSENNKDLALRLKTAEGEIQKTYNFDYVVMNHSNKIDDAIEQIKAIVTAEKCRAIPRKIIL